MDMVMDAQQKKFVFFLILAVVVGMLAGGKLLPLATSNQLSVVSLNQWLIINDKWLLIRRGELITDYFKNDL